jgi:GcrA cell cycle regulator
MIEAEEKWSPARVDLLKSLHSSGLSASLIAQQLEAGFTRNAVLGKLHRMGIGRLPPVERYEDDIPLRKSRKQAERPAPSLPPIIIREPDASQQRGLMTLEGGCKWPIGDPKAEDFVFCGHERRDDKSSYCEYHCRMAYRPKGLPS